MSRLSDTQIIILSAAAQRPDGNVLPLPGSLRGGAAGKVVTALLSRGLIREQVIDSSRTADPALNTVWRNLEDGRGVLLFTTGAGLEALGLGEATPTAGATGAGSGDAPEDSEEPEAPPAAPTAARMGKVREGTKQAALIGMLRRTEGATIAEIVAATGWQPHTVRGAFAGALKKRLGLAVASEKVEGRGRVYRIDC
jgi:hypothetical protein